MTNLKQWLGAERGRHAALAEHLGVTPGRVTQMAEDGVPKRHMMAVHAFTKRAVTLKAMLSQPTKEAA